MKLRQLLFALLLSLTVLSCSPNKNFTKKTVALDNNAVLVHKDFQRYFDDCSVEGSIVIFDNTNKQWILSDTIDIKTETLPASTFKIINLLIALETKAIANENELVRWVGETDTIKYGYRPEIYHDMTVKEAFEVSAGWVFIELAKKIGKNEYEKYLKLCNYGNLDLSQTNDDFWNFGRFAISPINQVEFLKNLYDEKLPFSKRNMQIVKQVLVSDQNESFTISSKTGWTRENNLNTGWWVGYLESKNNVYFFATRLLQDRKLKRDDFGNCRKNITKEVFRDLSIIK